MSNGETLHTLIDTLPAAVLEATERVLRSYQTWPPQPHVDFQKMQERVRERFERSARLRASQTGRGVIGASSGGSSFTPDGNGYASMVGWEGEASVKVELRVFKGHKMELEERVRLSADQRVLLYSQKIKGPTGKEDFHEIQFDLTETG